VIPRGSVANLLLSQRHLGGRPRIDHEPIDIDYSPLTNPPDSPPDSPLPRPVRDHRKTRRGAKKEEHPGERQRSLRRQRQPLNDYQGTGSRSYDDGQDYRGIRCGKYILRARIKAGCQDGQDPVFAGNTPLERWKDARLRCSDQ
jgi:hypothetical protein